MLDDFKEKQENAYNILINEIKNNRISHAYLIDENNYDLAFEFVLSFVKEVLGSKLSDESRMELFKRIDDDNYPEVNVIIPDGSLIKKQQILSLQQDFSMQAIEGSKRVYIIRSADKMRSETANSMLKFLEEPDNDILAILMTNNYNGILKTIVSRCQFIKLSNDSLVKNDNDLDFVVVNFIVYLEEFGIKTILKDQELLSDLALQKDRQKLEEFFDKMIDIYYDIMKVLLGNNNIKYSAFMDKIKEISMKNSEESINRKIDYLLMARERIKYNVNINLLVLDMIVNIGGNNENRWSKVW